MSGRVWKVVETEVGQVGVKIEDDGLGFYFIFFHFPFIFSYFFIEE